jgi:hypothetical protein
MTHFPQPHPTHRAARIQLGDFAPAIVKLQDGQHTKARIQTVSVNGGLLQLAAALEEGHLVEVAFETLSGPVRGMAEMLHPRQVSANATLQGFRFVALDDGDHSTLTMTVNSTIERNNLFGTRRHSS